MNIESQLTLRQIRAFVSVYRNGKLSTAAEEMGVTQSAVSVMIRQAEEILGARLFDRTTRSLVPTEAAEEAFGMAERIIQDVRMLGSAFRDMETGGRGRVRIAATPATAAALLPATVRAFARRYTNVGIVIDDCAPNQFLTQIQSERVDLGVGTPPPDGSAFDTEPLLEDGLHLVCARDHPLASRTSVAWKELKGESLIVFRPGYGVRQLIEAALHKSGVEAVATHEVGFLSTAAWMASSGLGVTILPRALAELEARHGLAVIALVEPSVARNIVLVTKKGRTLSRAAILFCDMLRSDLRRMAPAAVTTLP